MSFLINPYAFLAAGGDFESIATITVGSGGASSIEFTSIPGTYQHLQVRFIGTNTSIAHPDLYFRMNGDSGTNYTLHYLRGNGTSATAYGSGAGARTGLFFGNWSPLSTEGGVYAPVILDILDYADTGKYSTMRAFYGSESPSAPFVGITSSLWLNTAAVSSITMGLQASYNFAQYSTAALYGVRA